LIVVTHSHDLARSVEKCYRIEKGRLGVADLS
jgi:ABC-type lipoprotein export system ATPase subunit